LKIGSSGDFEILPKTPFLSFPGHKISTRSTGNLFLKTPPKTPVFHPFSEKAQNHSKAGG
jgi:hypothetical protein